MILAVIKKLMPTETNLIYKLIFLFKFITSDSSSYFFFNLLINMYNKIANIIKIGTPIDTCALILVKNVSV